MIVIEVEDAEMRQALDELASRVNNLEPAMRSIGQSMLKSVTERFETKVDPTGRRWARLSPYTLAKKRGRGSILIDTGDMHASRGYRASRTYVDIGFGTHYAAFHEFGTSSMPRRGLLTANPVTGTLGENDRQSILQIIARHLTQK